MRRVDKPIRLYVLTIFIVIAYGILPFMSVLPIDSRTALLLGFRSLPLNGSILFLYNSNGEANLPLVLIALTLCVFSAASAVWAFYGDRAARAAVLSFVTLDVIFWSGFVVFGIINAESGNPAIIGWALQLVIPPFWLGFVWWNFTRPDVNAYIEFAARESV